MWRVEVVLWSSYEIGLRLVPQKPIDDMSALVQGMEGWIGTVKQQP